MPTRSLKRAFEIHLRKALRPVHQVAAFGLLGLPAGADGLTILPARREKLHPTLP